MPFRTAAKNKTGEKKKNRSPTELFPSFSQFKKNKTVPNRRGITTAPRIKTAAGTAKYSRLGPYFDERNFTIKIRPKKTADSITERTARTKRDGNFPRLSVRPDVFSKAYHPSDLLCQKCGIITEKAA